MTLPSLEKNPQAHWRHVKRTPSRKRGPWPEIFINHFPGTRKPINSSKGESVINHTMWETGIASPARNVPACGQKERAVLALTHEW